MSKTNKILEEEEIIQNKFSKEEKSPAKFGYIEIYPSNLATRGLFYRDGFRIFIRSADIKEVKYWSTINEQDPIAVDEASNYILTNCVEVHLGLKMFGSFKDICQEDRFQIILMIRDLTYPEPESSISSEVNCTTENCGIIRFDLNSNIIKTSEISEDLMKRYSNEEKCFILETKSFGTIKIKSPNIGVYSTATKIIKESRESGKKFDSTFISLLPYLVDKAPTKDELRKLEVDFQGWNPKKLSFYISIINQMKFLNTNTGTIELVKNCEKCGVEVSTPLTFPNGIKSLFIIQDWTSELL